MGVSISNQRGSFKVEGLVVMFKILVRPESRNRCTRKRMKGGTAGGIATEDRGVCRDLQGFSAESLQAHVMTLAENCRAEGFGVWRVV